MPALRPTALKNMEDRVLRVTWSDDVIHEHTYTALRGACPCAQCVDEWSGARLLDRSRIDPNVHPASITLVGNYAVRFRWSDGHETGIYTFEALRKLGDAIPLSPDAGTLKRRHRPIST